jgi:ribonuclease HI
VNRFALRTDGGARGNPGPAGIAFVLTDPTGAKVCEGGRFIGETTNNVAEYEALLWGLRTAADRGASPLTVYSDSELMVRQLTGRYRVKNEGLKPLYDAAKGLIRRVGDVRVVHVRREDNREADALANAAMDCRGIVGDAPHTHGVDHEQPPLFE